MSTSRQEQGAMLPRSPVLGILTGVSYVSGIDYFKGINELYTTKASRGHAMVPNPDIVMASIDCDIYVKYLNEESYDDVKKHLLTGIRRLHAAGCELLSIASNTAHMCVPVVEKEFPSLQIIHIADCCAARLKARGIKSVGLIGTKATMECDYLKDRLLRHGIVTIVPEHEETRVEIFRIIVEELSYNNFVESSRQNMVRAIEELGHRGANACILGCTEIELLVQQEHIPNIELLPSARVHIETVVDVLLGNVQISHILPSL